MDNTTFTTILGRPVVPHHLTFTREIGEHQMSEDSHRIDNSDAVKNLRESYKKENMFSVVNIRNLEIAQHEAQKIQEAIEFLNRNGFEHHFANQILQIELGRCETRMWLYALAEEKR